jgi:hypothetical protein
MTASFLSRTGRHSTLLALGCAVTALFGVVAPSSYASLADRPAAVPRAATSPTARYVETRLFFGTERPDGGPAVTDAQFTAFVDREVTPSFPDGLTVQDGWGQWRDSRGAIERERSHELILLYPKSEAAARDTAVERIRDAYVRAYAQDSVARLDEPALVDF